MKRFFWVLVGVIGLLAIILQVAGAGCFGRHEGPGEITQSRRPAAVISTRGQEQRAAAQEAGAAGAKQVLFGDLHVHTTVSLDAFAGSLPLVQGEGAHPQADACDFARFCSALDFWSINDHAASITPAAWRETAEAIRQCNAVAGDPSNPDTVAFLGWEWTQTGGTPQSHYGHRNVVLAHTEEELIPPRPVAVRRLARLTQERLPGRFTTGLLALLGRDRRYHDAALYVAERRGLVECEPGANRANLADDCIVTAETPADLLRQLETWGHEAIVIPHGTTWGLYTPPGSTWDDQLTPSMHNPDLQVLLEVYSGHGNSEEYRSYRGVEFDASGAARCPEPTRGYLPLCWRAGEIVRGRCLAEGIDPHECEARALTARQHAADAGSLAHLTVPGTDPTEWLDAGQCRDCAQPTFNYRPGGAAQYLMALRRVAENGQELRFRFGFMASSDNHFARAGTGYKEIHRRGMTESRGLRRRGTGILGRGQREPPEARSRPMDPENLLGMGLRRFEWERQASFFLTGGLVAVHAQGRDRAEIWSSLRRREVYGTSGPRILLWFDLLNPPGAGGAPAPMGSQVAMSETPGFQVRAVGSFVQRPGCPDYATGALSTERLQHLCKGECYHPSDERRRITRIEVVRIRPQDRADEPVAPLIEDPWRVFACEPDPAGCTVRFDDPEHAAAGRDALYYVRALEEPGPGINAGGLRCELDAAGECTRVDLCGDPDAPTDDCLSDHEPRAWSSPIFVDWPGE